MLPSETHAQAHAHRKRDIWPQAEPWSVPKERSAEIKKKVEKAPAEMPIPEESCFTEAKGRAGHQLRVTEQVTSDLREPESVGLPGMKARHSRSQVAGERRSKQKRGSLEGSGSEKDLCLWSFLRQKRPEHAVARDEGLVERADGRLRRSQTRGNEVTLKGI